MANSLRMRSAMSLRCKICTSVAISVAATPSSDWPWLMVDCQHRLYVADTSRLACIECSMNDGKRSTRTDLACKKGRWKFNHLRLILARTGQIDSLRRDKIALPINFHEGWWRVQNCVTVPHVGLTELLHAIVLEALVALRDVVRPAGVASVGLRGETFRQILLTWAHYGIRHEGWNVFGNCVRETCCRPTELLRATVRVAGQAFHVWVRAVRVTGQTRICRSRKRLLHSDLRMGRNLRM